jgi:polysaccharide biosynthesis/export protein
MAETLHVLHVLKFESHIKKFNSLLILRLLSLLVLTTIVSACSAPGMKLSMRPGAKPEATSISGIAVNLYPLNAETIVNQQPLQPNLSSLKELLVQSPPSYQIGPKDILLVTVWDHPEITLPLGQYRSDSSSGLVVDEEGNLYFPYINKFHVQGLTITQARDTLTDKLSKVLQKPQVDVKVIAFRSQSVYVGGEVKSPAVYNITDVPFTLAEAINRAGGFLPTSDDSHIILTRNNHSWIINFPLMIASGNLIGEILLKDGDSLYISSSSDSPVYLMGEFTRPGTLPLPHGSISLARAISDVGGIISTSADASSIYVIRQGSVNNSADVFHLDAKDPTAMILADQFKLMPRDIVYVDAGSTVRFSRVMSLILPTFSAITSTAMTAAEIRYLKRP